MPIDAETFERGETIDSIESEILDLLYGKGLCGDRKVVRRPVDSGGGTRSYYRAPEAVPGREE